MKKKILMTTLTCLLLTSCIKPSAQRDINQVQDPDGKRLTIADVQSKIHVGMASADVISALGPPNMITYDSQGQDVWTYDKVSSQQAYSQQSGGIFGSLLPGGQSGAKSSVQKTMTVIVKFDKKKKVKDYKFLYSQF